METSLNDGQLWSATGLLLIASEDTAMPIENSVVDVRDSRGNITSVSPTFRGVGEPQPSSEALEEVFQKVQQAKREWEATVDSLSDLILLVDNSGQVIRANRTVESWNLGQVKQVAGRQLNHVLHPACQDSGCSLNLFVSQALKQTSQGQTLEHEIYDQGLNRYLLIKAQPILNAQRSTVDATVIVLQDITERKRIEESLRRYAGELQTRNEELDAFAHTVAHDLKNPVSLIIGYAELSLRDLVAASNSDLVEALQIIARTGNKMNTIIEELLLLAQVRDAHVEIESLSMGPIVYEARQRLAHISQECGAEIVLPQEWPRALGYGSWIEEVWANYLANALKYGGHPPRVELGATEQPDGMVRFWARDHGPGLTAEQQAKLFTPFTRLDRVRANGHGLGLSIVKRIVEKLGGQVAVESEGIPGRGCVFSFTLPRGG